MMRATGYRLPATALGALALAVAACKAGAPMETAPIQTAPPQPSPSQATEERFLTACTEACERSRAMRAVAWEMIQAECRGDCAADWRLPFLERASDLAARDRDRVRVRGKLTFPGKDSKEAVLELNDGTKLAVRLAHTSPPEGTVVAVGTIIVEGGHPHLEHVTLVAAD